MNRIRDWVVLGLLAVLAGCTSVKEGIVGTEHEDIVPFAQKTVEVLGVQNIQLRKSELIHLRKYTYDSFQQLDKLQEQIAAIDDFRDRVIGYSIDLVRATEMHSHEENRVSAYADVLDGSMRNPMTVAGIVSENEFDEVLVQVRAQSTLLGALRAFQPVINKAGTALERLINEIEDETIPAVRDEFDQRIQHEFRYVLGFYDAHFTNHDELLFGLAALQRYRQGEKGAIADFRSEVSEHNASVFGSNQPNTAAVRKAELELGARLTQSRALLDAEQLDLEHYKASVLELDNQEQQLYKDLSVARLQLVIWTRAHQALANGVKDPGAWLEYGETAYEIIRGVM